ncbi:MAG: exopolysaccharide biosynthesis polyprenyl glycosylphosphotransferase [Campylobacterales bacterium]|nr:exopolysaccharide biosynthesis polyprenyl glycosylphosphotransferase [Campylobacterales bacterium]
MKNNISKIFLVSSDLLAIALSIVLAYYTRQMFDGLFGHALSIPLEKFLSLYMLFFAIIGMFFYEGSYTKRFDFWHESRQVLKGLFFAFLLIMAYLAITKSVTNYSRFVIVFVFVYASFFVPLFKNILKKLLYKAGIWQREAKVYGDDEFVQTEIFGNPYLGYVHADKKEPKTVFINSSNLNASELESIIDSEICSKHEVIFIPMIKGYELSQSYIYELSNTRTNLIEIKNRLKSKYRRRLQEIFNYAFALLLLPVLLPIIAILAYLIKKESPGSVFFSHNRIGKRGKIIPTWKFRSMYQDAAERLEKLLAEDENIRKEWETNFKLRDDPRVTKIGAFLRKTSLDELPQIFNVLKGEMNFVGPRPVIQKEIDQYYKENAEYYLMVKPGITGLWQVSGRSDTDYDFRIATDKWYVTNWSLWLDIVILFKTIKVVLLRKGAY